MSRAVRARAPIGWFRAIVTVVVIVAVGVALVYGTNAVLTKAHRLTRSGAVAIATSMFLGVLVVMAVALRLLQRRRVL